MSRRLHNAIRRWLRHERAASDRRAERALGAVFAHLPLAAPSPDFAGRVLAAVGLALPARVARDLRGARWKVAIAACFALAAGSLAFLPSVARALWVALASGMLLDAAVGGLIDLAVRLAQSVAIVQVMASAGRALGSAVASPGVLAAIALCALLSLAGFWLLQGLMVSQRSTRHV